MNSNQAQTPRVSIKNLKFSEFASHETHCFEASVYIDGVRKGVASNDGYGGPNNYQPWSLHEELAAIAKDLPLIDMTECGSNEPLPHSPDIIIGDLVDAELARKKIARMVATKTWFRKPGEKYQHGEWSYLTAKTSPATIAHLHKKYGAETVILGHNCHKLD